MRGVGAARDGISCPLRLSFGFRFRKEVDKARKIQEHVLQELRIKSEADREAHVKEVERLKVSDDNPKRGGSEGRSYYCV